MIFKLTRPAKKQGGDRYETDVKGESKPWVVYIPQTISRYKGKIIEEFEITFNPQ